MTQRNILSFLKVSDNSQENAQLPCPQSPAEKSVDVLVSEAKNVTPVREIKRKRNDYGDYSPETRMKIAKFAVENGNSRAARHFSHKLGRKINESIVRGMKASYQRQQQQQKEEHTSTSTSTSTVLPRSPRGNP